MSQWILTKYFDQLPPENVVVETKDSDGNLEFLQRKGNLWWTVMGGMECVYYTPKFWRYIQLEDENEPD